MNPRPSLNTIGLPHEMDAITPEEAVKFYVGKISAIDSQEM
jgi:hypothetical protein